MGQKKNWFISPFILHIPISFPLSAAVHPSQTSPAITAVATTITAVATTIPTIPITTISASVATIPASVTAIPAVAAVDGQGDRRVEGERAVATRKASATELLEVTGARRRQGTHDDQEEQQLRN